MSRQDHPLPDHHRGATPGRGFAYAWRDGQNRLCGPGSCPGRDQDGLGSDLGGPRHPHAWENRSQFSRLLRALQPDRRRSTEKSEGALGWRAQTCALGQNAQARRKSSLLDEPTNDLDVTTLRALERVWSALGDASVVESRSMFLIASPRISLRLRTRPERCLFEGTIAIRSGPEEAFRKTAERPHRLRYKSLHSTVNLEETRLNV